MSKITDPPSGIIGQIIGSGVHAQVNSALIILVILLTLGTIMTLHFGVSNTTELWKTGIFPLCTGIVGYMLGGKTNSSH